MPFRNGYPEGPRDLRALDESQISELATSLRLYGNTPDNIDQALKLIKRAFILGDERLYEKTKRTYQNGLHRHNTDRFDLPVDASNGEIATKYYEELRVYVANMLGIDLESPWDRINEHLNPKISLCMRLKIPRDSSWEEIAVADGFPPLQRN